DSGEFPGWQRADHRPRRGRQGSLKGRCYRIPARAMVLSMNRTSEAPRNIRVRSYLTLLLVMPALAASPGDVSGGRIKTVVLADAKTGRLVRTRLVESAAIGLNATPESANLQDLVDRIADEQGVESPLVHSLIRAES